MPNGPHFITKVAPMSLNLCFFEILFQVAFTLERTGKHKRFLNLKTGMTS